MAGARIVNYRLDDRAPALWRSRYALLTHYFTASFAGHFFFLLLHQPSSLFRVPQWRRFIVLCLLFNSFFSLSPNLTCTSVPSSDCVMLYYTLDAQLFLQPQPQPHMYLSAVSWFRYAVLYAWCSTLSSASASTSHMPQCRHLTALCCIIRLLLNSVFSLSPNLTMKTFCNGYKKFIHQDQRQHQQVNSNCDSKQGVNSRASCRIRNCHPTTVWLTHSLNHTGISYQADKAQSADVCLPSSFTHFFHRFQYMQLCYRMHLHD